ARATFAKFVQSHGNVSVDAADLSRLSRPADLHVSIDAFSFERSLDVARGHASVNPLERERDIARSFDGHLLFRILAENMLPESNVPGALAFNEQTRGSLF